MKLRTKITALLLIAVGLLLRLRALPPALGDVDGVNFARALVHFDPLHQSPHLPGYPVYVAATKLFALFGSAQIQALVLPAAVSFVAGALLLFAGLARRAGDDVALGATAVVALAPGAVLVGAWPGSDGLGFSILLAAAGLIAGWPERTLGAGLLLGLLLGTRLSWWPLVGSAFFLSPNPRRLAAGAGAATGAWLLGLFLFASPAALATGAGTFAKGHFLEWGGTAVTSEGRLPAAWHNLVELQLGGPALALAAGALAVVGLAKTERGPWTALPLAIALPYVAWVLLAQNLDKARHLVPLLPLVGALAGLGLARLPSLRRFAAPGLVLLLGSVSFGRAEAQGEQRAPAAALADHLLTRSPERLQVFAGPSARVIEQQAPMIRVWRAKDGDVLTREARAAHARGADVLVTSDAEGAHRLPLEQVARFEAPPEVRPEEPRLILYRFVPEEHHARR